MVKKWLVILVVLAVVVTASVVVAIGPRGKGQPAPGVGAQSGCMMMGTHMMRELGLTQDQLAQMKELHKECFDATKATREQIQVKAKEMVNLAFADQPDADAIKRLAAEIDALRADVRNMCIDQMLRGLRILTAEQREKVRKKMESSPGMGCMGFGCSMGGGMGMGMGPGMGDGTGPRSKTGTCPMMKK